MANFEKAFNKTIVFEGGLSDHDKDRGGLTKYGISKRAYPHLNIADLTVEAAQQIYQRDYWDRLNLSWIISQEIANELFDTAVNCGVRTAAKFLQRAINFVIKPDLLKVDGIIGPITTQIINKYSHGERKMKAILKTLNGFQFMHYVYIAKEDPSQQVFFRGWLRRVWEG